MSTNKINFGDNNQSNNVIGDGNTVHNTINGASQGGSADELMAAIRDAVKESGAEDFEAVNDNSIVPLEEIAKGDAPATEEAKQTLKNRIATYMKALEPYAPYIKKKLAQFAQGALAALPPPVGLVVAGCLEALKDEA
jgi:hypothetical protein